jgi:acyl carrier protein
MNTDSARALFSSLIHEIAPEVDLDAVDHTADLQDELDLDSVDFLNLVSLIYERTGLNIPETEYHNLATVDATIAYLAERAASGSRDDSL